MRIEKLLKKGQAQWSGTSWPQESMTHVWPCYSKGYKSTEEKLSKRNSPVLSAGDTRDQKEPESCHRFAKPEQTLVNEKLSGGTG